MNDDERFQKNEPSESTTIELSKKMIKEYVDVENVFIKIHKDKCQAGELMCALLSSSIQNAINVIGSSINGTPYDNKKHLIENSKLFFNTSLDNLLKDK